MSVILKQPKTFKNGVYLIATVSSRSRPGKTHTVMFIRKPGMKRVVCSCENFFYDRMQNRRHCDHIHEAIAAKDRAYAQSQAGQTMHATM